MAVANSYSNPAAAGGNREDLRDVLTILEPEETPVTSLIPKIDKPGATYVEWLADTIRKPRKTGTVEGGTTITRDNKAAERKRFGNYIHLYTNGYGVTDVQAKVDVAAIGEAGEFDYAKAMAVREAKRDMEAILCSDQEMQQGSGSNEWRTRGLFKWIQSTAQTVNPVPTKYLTPAGNIITGLTAANLQEAQVVDVLKSLFQVFGVKKTYIMPASAGVVAAFDGFTRTQPSATAQRYVVSDAAEKRAINMEVKTFNCSFGMLNIVPNLFLRVDANGDPDDNAALILVRELLGLGVLENLHAVDDTNNNPGGPQGYLKAMFALMHKNPRGSGKFQGT